MTQRFLRHGNYLAIVVVVYDPVYLTEPFIRTTDFVLNTHQWEIPPYPCESVEEVNWPAGFVPNRLPGQNQFPDEFPANYGIPPEAALGGAETMYPEYIKKMESMKRLPRPQGIHHNR